MISQKPWTGLISARDRDIARRFTDREQALRYHGRFQTGKRRRTHQRESVALEAVLAALETPQVIVDVGAGTGRFAPIFSRTGAQLLQLDISRPMLEVNRQQHPLRGPAGGYVQADAQRIPLPDRSADLVFCHRLLNHIPLAEDRRDILRELARISRGHVVVSCLEPLRPLRMVRRVFDRVTGRDSRDGHVDQEALLEEAGQVGLTLIRRTPIRTGLASATFLTFAVR